MQNPEVLPLLPSLKRKPERRSVLSLATSVWLAMGALAILDTANAIRPVPQPQRISRSGAFLSPSAATTKPCPDAEIDELMATLSTVEDFQEFLDANTTQALPGDVPTFVTTFRQPPERFQREKWSGPCNSFAEFAAYWAYVHGGTPYIVTLWPNGILDKCRENWHQIAVCRTHETELFIFNNKSVTGWRGTIAEYVEKEYPEKSVASLGGVIPWQLTQDTIRAKIASHTVCNTEDLAISPLPLRSAPPPQLIAKD